MTTLPLLIGVVLVAGALVAVAVATGTVAAGSKQVRERLVGVGTSGTGPALSLTGVSQSDADSVLQRLVPESSKQKMRRNLELAGHPGGWTLQRMITLRFGFVFLGAVLLVLTLVKDAGVVMLAASLVTAVGGWMAPGILLGGQAVARQDKIQRALPDTLDSVLISIEAGLSLEAALARTGRSGNGPLFGELVRLTQDISLGMARRDAYLALAGRTTLEELRKFVTAVVQAEEFGVSVSQIVRTQAAEMRVKRRLRAEGQAHKTAVKILFPLMACILPVLFIVILAPAILTAVSMF